MKNLREFALEAKKDKIAYLPGDIIHGELFICLEEPVPMKCMKIVLFGEGQGQFLQQSFSVAEQNEKEEEEGDENSEPSKKRLKTDEEEKKPKYVNPEKKLVLVDIELVVFGKDGASDSELQTHESGRFSYEFEFNIPQNLPCTFKSPPDRNLGFSKYYLKAIIQRPKKHDQITKMVVVINHPLDPSRPELAYQPGSNVNKEVSTACMPSGTLALESYLNQSIYKQGERILINAVADNGSTRVMKEMYAKLIRRVCYKARFGTKTYTVDTTSTHGARVPPQEKLEWKDRAMRVPAVGPTVSGNVDIRVDYVVRVGMYEDMGSEIHVDLPVVIGTLADEKDKEEEADEDASAKPKKRPGLEVIKANARDKHKKDLDARIEAHPASENDDGPEEDSHTIKKEEEEFAAVEETLVYTEIEEISYLDELDKLGAPGGKYDDTKANVKDRPSSSATEYKANVPTKEKDVDKSGDKQSVGKQGAGNKTPRGKAGSGTKAQPEKVGTDSKVSDGKKDAGRRTPTTDKTQGSSGRRKSSGYSEAETGAIAPGNKKLPAGDRRGSAQATVKTKDTPAAELRATAETPIIPSSPLKDLHANVDEEAFLKEFERLEEEFRKESPSAPPLPGYDVGIAGNTDAKPDTRDSDALVTSSAPEDAADQRPSSTDPQRKISPDWRTYLDNTWQVGQGDTRRPSMDAAGEGMTGNVPPSGADTENKVKETLEESMIGEEEMIEVTETGELESTPDMKIPEDSDDDSDTWLTGPSGRPRGSSDANLSELSPIREEGSERSSIDTKSGHKPGTRPKASAGKSEATKDDSDLESWYSEGTSDTDFATSSDQIKSKDTDASKSATQPSVDGDQDVKMSVDTTRPRSVSPAPPTGRRASRSRSRSASPSAEDAAKRYTGLSRSGSISSIKGKPRSRSGSVTIDTINPDARSRSGSITASYSVDNPWEIQKPTSDKIAGDAADDKDFLTSKDEMNENRSDDSISSPPTKATSLPYNGAPRSRSASTSESTGPSPPSRSGSRTGREAKPDKTTAGSADMTKADGHLSADSADTIGTKSPPETDTDRKSSRDSIPTRSRSTSPYPASGRRPSRKGSKSSRARSTTPTGGEENTFTGLPRSGSTKSLSRSRPGSISRAPSRSGSASRKPEVKTKKGASTSQPESGEEKPGVAGRAWNKFKSILPFGKRDDGVSDVAKGKRGDPGDDSRTVLSEPAVTTTNEPKLEAKVETELSRGSSLPGGNLVSEQDRSKSGRPSTDESYKIPPVTKGTEKPIEKAGVGAGDGGHKQGVETENQDLPESGKDKSNFDAKVDPRPEAASSTAEVDADTELIMELWDKTDEIENIDEEPKPSTQSASGRRASRGIITDTGVAYDEDNDLKDEEGERSASKVGKGDGRRRSSDLKSLDPKTKAKEGPQKGKESKDSATNKYKPGDQKGRKGSDSATTYKPPEDSDQCDNDAEVLKLGDFETTSIPDMSTDKRKSGSREDIPTSARKSGTPRSQSAGGKQMDPVQSKGQAASAANKDAAKEKDKRGTEPRGKLGKEPRVNKKADMGKQDTTGSQDGKTKSAAGKPGSKFGGNDQAVGGQADDNSNAELDDPEVIKLGDLDEIFVSDVNPETAQMYSGERPLLDSSLSATKPTGKGDPMRKPPTSKGKANQVKTKKTGPEKPAQPKLGKLEKKGSAATTDRSPGLKSGPQKKSGTPGTSRASSTGSLDKSFDEDEGYGTIKRPSKAGMSKGKTTAPASDVDSTKTGKGPASKPITSNKSSIPDKTSSQPSKLNKLADEKKSKAGSKPGTTAKDKPSVGVQPSKALKPKAVEQERIAGTSATASPPAAKTAAAAKKTDSSVKPSSGIKNKPTAAKKKTPDSKPDSSAKAGLTTRADSKSSLDSEGSLEKKSKGAKTTPKADGTSSNDKTVKPERKSKDAKQPQQNVDALKKSAAHKPNVAADQPEKVDDGEYATESEDDFEYKSAPPEDSGTELPAASKTTASKPTASTKLPPKSSSKAPTKAEGKPRTSVTDTKSAAAAPIGSSKLKTPQSDAKKKSDTKTKPESSAKSKGQALKTQSPDRASSNEVMTDGDSEGANQDDNEIGDEGVKTAAEHDSQVTDTDHDDAEEEEGISEVDETMVEGKASELGDESDDDEVDRDSKDQTDPRKPGRTGRSPGRDKQKSKSKDVGSSKDSLQPKEIGKLAKQKDEAKPKHAQTDSKQKPASKSTKVAGSAKSPKSVPGRPRSDEDEATSKKSIPSRRDSKNVHDDKNLSEEELDTDGDEATSQPKDKSDKSKSDKNRKVHVGEVDEEHVSESDRWPTDSDEYFQYSEDERVEDLYDSEHDINAQVQPPAKSQNKSKPMTGKKTKTGKNRPEESSKSGETAPYNSEKPHSTTDTAVKRYAQDAEEESTENDEFLSDEDSITAATSKPGTGEPSTTTVPEVQRKHAPGDKAVRKQEPAKESRQKVPKTSSKPSRSPKDSKEEGRKIPNATAKGERPTGPIEDQPSFYPIDDDGEEDRCDDQERSAQPKREKREKSNDRSPKKDAKSKLKSPSSLDTEPTKRSKPSKASSKQPTSESITDDDGEDEERAQDLKTPGKMRKSDEQPRKSAKDDIQTERKQKVASFKDNEDPLDQESADEDTEETEGEEGAYVDDKKQELGKPKPKKEVPKKTVDKRVKRPPNVTAKGKRPVSTKPTKGIKPATDFDDPSQYDVDREESDTEEYDATKSSTGTKDADKRSAKDPAKSKQDTPVTKKVSSKTRSPKKNVKDEKKTSQPSDEKAREDEMYEESALQLPPTPVKDRTSGAHPEKERKRSSGTDNKKQPKLSQNQPPKGSLKSEEDLELPQRPTEERASRKQPYKGAIKAVKAPAREEEVGKKTSDNFDQAEPSTDEEEYHSAQESTEDPEPSQSDDRTYTIGHKPKDDEEVKGVTSAGKKVERQPSKEKRSNKTLKGTDPDQERHGERKSSKKKPEAQENNKKPATHPESDSVHGPEPSRKTSRSKSPHSKTGGHKTTPETTVNIIDKDTISDDDTERPYDSLDHSEDERTDTYDDGTYTIQRDNKASDKGDTTPKAKTHGKEIPEPRSKHKSQKMPSKSTPYLDQMHDAKGFAYDSDHGEDSDMENDDVGEAQKDSEDVLPRPTKSTKELPPMKKGKPESVKDKSKRAPSPSSRQKPSFKDSKGSSNYMPGDANGTEDQGVFSGSEGAPENIDKVISRPRKSTKQLPQKQKGRAKSVEDKSKSSKSPSSREKSSRKDEKGLSEEMDGDGEGKDDEEGLVSGSEGESEDSSCGRQIEVGMPISKKSTKEFPRDQKGRAKPTEDKSQRAKSPSSRKTPSRKDSKGISKDISHDGKAKDDQEGAISGTEGESEDLEEAMVKPTKSTKQSSPEKKERANSAGKNKTRSHSPTSRKTQPSKESKGISEDISDGGKGAEDQEGLVSGSEGESEDSSRGRQIEVGMPISKKSTKEFPRDQKGRAKPIEGKSKRSQSPSSRKSPSRKDSKGISKDISHDGKVKDDQEGVISGTEGESEDIEEGIVKPTKSTKQSPPEKKERAMSADKKKKRSHSAPSRKTQPSKANKCISEDISDDGKGTEDQEGLVGGSEGESEDSSRSWQIEVGMPISKKSTKEFPRDQQGRAKPTEDKSKRLQSPSSRKTPSRKGSTGTSKDMPHDGKGKDDQEGVISGTEEESEDIEEAMVKPTKSTKQSPPEKKQRAKSADGKKKRSQSPLARKNRPSKDSKGISEDMSGDGKGKDDPEGVISGTEGESEDMEEAIVEPTKSTKKSPSEKKGTAKSVDEKKKHSQIPPSRQQQPKKDSKGVSESMSDDADGTEEEEDSITGTATMDTERTKAGNKNLTAKVTKANKEPAPSKQMQRKRESKTKQDESKTKQDDHDAHATEDDFDTTAELGGDSRDAVKDANMYQENSGPSDEHEITPAKQKRTARPSSTKSKYPAKGEIPEAEKTPTKATASSPEKGGKTKSKSKFTSPDRKAASAAREPKETRQKSPARTKDGVSPHMAERQGQPAKSLPRKGERSPVAKSADKASKTSPSKLHSKKPETSSGDRSKRPAKMHDPNQKDKVTKATEETIEPLIVFPVKGEKPKMTKTKPRGSLKPNKNDQDIKDKEIESDIEQDSPIDPSTKASTKTYPSKGSKGEPSRKEWDKPKKPFAAVGVTSNMKPKVNTGIQPDGATFVQIDLSMPSDEQSPSSDDRDQDDDPSSAGDNDFEGQNQLQSSKGEKYPTKQYAKFIGRKKIDHPPSGTPPSQRKKRKQWSDEPETQTKVVEPTLSQPRLIVFGAEKSANKGEYEDAQPSGSSVQFEVDETESDQGSFIPDGKYRVQRRNTPYPIQVPKTIRDDYQPNKGQYTVFSRDPSRPVQSPYTNKSETMMQLPEVPGTKTPTRQARQSPGKQRGAESKCKAGNEQPVLYPCKSHHQTGKSDDDTQKESSAKSIKGRRGSQTEASGEAKSDERQTYFPVKDGSIKQPDISQTKLSLPPLPPGVDEHDETGKEIPVTAKAQKGPSRGSIRTSQHAVAPTKRGHMVSKDKQHMPQKIPTKSSTISPGITREGSVVLSAAGKEPKSLPPRSQVMPKQRQDDAKYSQRAGNFFVFSRDPSDDVTNENSREPEMDPTYKADQKYDGGDSSKRPFSKYSHMFDQSPGIVEDSLEESDQQPHKSQDASKYVTKGTKKGKQGLKSHKVVRSPSDSRAQTRKRDDSKNITDKRSRSASPRNTQRSDQVPKYKKGQKTSEAPVILRAKNIKSPRDKQFIKSSVPPLKEIILDSRSKAQPIVIQPSASSETESQASSPRRDPHGHSRPRSLSPASPSSILLSKNRPRSASPAKDGETSPRKVRIQEPDIKKPRRQLEPTKDFKQILRDKSPSPVEPKAIVLGETKTSHRSESVNSQQSKAKPSAKQEEKRPSQRSYEKPADHKKRRPKSQSPLRLNEITLCQERSRSASPYFKGKGHHPGQDGPGSMHQSKGGLTGKYKPSMDSKQRQNERCEHAFDHDEKSNQIQYEPQITLTSNLNASQEIDQPEKPQLATRQATPRFHEPLPDTYSKYHALHQTVPEDSDEELVPETSARKTRPTKRSKSMGIRRARPMQPYQRSRSVSPSGTAKIGVDSRGPIFPYVGHIEWLDEQLRRSQSAEDCRSRCRYQSSRGIERTDNFTSDISDLLRDSEIKFDPSYDFENISEPETAATAGTETRSDEELFATGNLDQPATEDITTKENLILPVPPKTSSTGDDTPMEPCESKEPSMYTLTPPYATDDPFKQVPVTFRHTKEHYGALDPALEASDISQSDPISAGNELTADRDDCNRTLSGISELSHEESAERDHVLASGIAAYDKYSAGQIKSDGLDQPQGRDHILEKDESYVRKMFPLREHEEANTSDDIEESFGCDDAAKAPLDPADDASTNFPSKDLVLPYVPAIKDFQKKEQPDLSLSLERVENKLEKINSEVLLTSEKSPQTDIPPSKSMSDAKTKESPRSCSRLPTLVKLSPKGETSGSPRNKSASDESAVKSKEDKSKNSPLICGTADCLTDPNQGMGSTGDQSRSFTHDDRVVISGIRDFKSSPTKSAKKQRNTLPTKEPAAKSRSKTPSSKPTKILSKGPSTPKDEMKESPVPTKTHVALPITPKVRKTVPPRSRPMPLMAKPVSRDPSKSNDAIKRKSKKPPNSVPEPSTVVHEFVAKAEEFRVGKTIVVGAPRDIALVTEESTESGEDTTKESSAPEDIVRNQPIQIGVKKPVNKKDWTSKSPEKDTSIVLQQAQDSPAAKTYDKSKSIPSKGTVTKQPKGSPKDTQKDQKKITSTIKKREDERMLLLGVSPKEDDKPRKTMKPITLGRGRKQESEKEIEPIPIQSRTKPVVTNALSKDKSKPNIKHQKEKSPIVLSPSSADRSKSPTRAKSPASRGISPSPKQKPTSRRSKTGSGLNLPEPPTEIVCPIVLGKCNSEPATSKPQSADDESSYEISISYGKPKHDPARRKPATTKTDNVKAREPIPIVLGASPKRSQNFPRKHNRSDSFEEHEQRLGIVDEFGRALSNDELMSRGGKGLEDDIEQQKVPEISPGSDRGIPHAYSSEAIDDLEDSQLSEASKTKSKSHRHITKISLIDIGPELEALRQGKRWASCPAHIGEREGMYIYEECSTSISSDVYSDDMDNVDDLDDDDTIQPDDEFEPDELDHDDDFEEDNVDEDQEDEQEETDYGGDTEIEDESYVDDGTGNDDPASGDVTGQETATDQDDGTEPEPADDTEGGEEEITEEGDETSSEKNARQPENRSKEPTRRVDSYGRGPKPKFSRPHYYKSTTEDSSTTQKWATESDKYSVYKTSFGSFGYEEHVVETYQVIEERNLRVKDLDQ